MPYDTVAGSTDSTADGGVYNPIAADPSVLIDAAAATSAGEAAASASDAAASALAAAASAAAALVSQGAASASAAAALVSQNAAAASAAAALVSENNAATSATTATTQAGIATTQATNAGNSATAAGASATSANNSAISAAASYDSFDDRYLGAKAANPTLDNDGNALLVGAIYFNTVASEMRVWTGSVWILATGIAGVATFNTRSGAVTLTSGDVTGALTYTPYNAANPAGYITSAALAAYLALAGGTMSGAILGALGAVGTPGYAFSGDANTGMYSVGADQLNFATAGVLRHSISAVGRHDFAAASAGYTAVISTATGSALALTGAVSGNSVTSVLENTSNTASSNATQLISVGGSSAGDAALSFEIAGTQAWTFGIDNSDSDRLKISRGSALGTTDSLSLDTSGNVGVGANPTGRLSVVTTGATGLNSSAWDSTAAVFGPNAGSATGSAVSIGYDTTNNKGQIWSLGPTVAWRPLEIGAATIRFLAAAGGQNAELNSTGFTDGHNFIVGASYSSPHAANGRAVVGANGSSSALLGLSIAGASAGYMFHNGTNFNLNASVGNGNLSATSGTAFWSYDTDSIAGASAEIGWRKLPAASVTTGAFAATDYGKVVNASGGVTVPNSTMAAGDVVSIYNNTAGNITITATVTTLRLAGTATTGNRTLAQRGMASIYFVSGTEAVISGAGLT